MDFILLVWIVAAMILACYKIMEKDNKKKNLQRGVQQGPAEESVQQNAVHEGKGETSSSDNQDTMQSPLLLINLLGMLKATWLIDEPKSLTVVATDSKTLNDTTAIRNWQLLKPLLEQEDAECVTYVVGYEKERVCLTLTRQEEDEKMACFLIECRAKGVDFEKCIWHDKRSQAERLAEYRYMADEEGKETEPTPAQEDNDGQSEQPWACHLYWGKKAFLEEKFLNAIDELEKAFEMMQTNFLQMDEEQQLAFLEVIRMLGNSYFQLGFHKQAFFYLSVFENIDNLTLRGEFIHALVASPDYRAFSIIDRQIEASYEWMMRNRGHENYGEVYTYMEFTLQRSMVQLCINRGMLERAEMTLTMMTNEGNRDFVEEYRERIRQLREKQSNQ